MPRRTRRISDQQLTKTQGVTRRSWNRNLLREGKTEQEIAATPPRRARLNVAS